jgi:hypothetical protein
MVEYSPSFPAGTGYYGPNKGYATGIRPYIHLRNDYALRTIHLGIYFFVAS